jgi:LacI family transcriptional regulator
LQAEITEGKYSPSNRLPSEYQLVKRFNVSRPTIARALRGLQEKGLVQRRAGSGTYVVQKSPVGSGVRQLALLIPGLVTTEIFEVICGELASLARASEYTLLWGGSTHPREHSDSSRENAIELCEQFIERRGNGVFLLRLNWCPTRKK